MTEKPPGTDDAPRFPSESYTTDDQGNHVLIGLTQEETAELERLVRDYDRALALGKYAHHLEPAEISL